MLSDRLPGTALEITKAGCDLYEMGSGKVGISVGAIMAVFDPANSLLRYTAESPPPVLLTGNGRSLSLPSTSKDFVMTLASGSSCYFYEGENPTPALALHHIERTDITREAFEYSAHPICATIARDAMRVFCERAGMTVSQEFDLAAAVGEAVANAIEHCDKSPEATFTIDCQTQGRELYVHVESKGPWRAPIPDDEHGRGIPIMNACSRALDISSTQERTRVTLTF